MIDTLTLLVHDYTRSREVYLRALAAVDADHGTFVLDPDGFNIEAVCHG